MVSGLAESSFKDVPEIFEVGNVLFCCFVTHANYDGASLLAALLLFLRPGTPVGITPRCRFPIFYLRYGRSL